MTPLGQRVITQGSRSGSEDQNSWITESLRNQKPASLIFKTPDLFCRASVKTQLTVPDIPRADAPRKGTSPKHQLTVPCKNWLFVSQS